jgi:hypothetical protein
MGCKRVCSGTRPSESAAQSGPDVGAAPDVQALNKLQASSRRCAKKSLTSYEEHRDDCALLVLLQVGRLDLRSLQTVDPCHTLTSR